MKRNGFGLLALCLTAIVLTGCLETQSRDLYGLADKTHSAVTADHRFNWWGKRHYEVLDKVADGDVDLIMVGDSITHSWENSGKAM